VLFSLSLYQATTLQRNGNINIAVVVVVTDVFIPPAVKIPRLKGS